MSFSPLGRVIGVGSPFGADRAGWEAIEALRRSDFVTRFPKVELEIADRPGNRLIARFSGVPRVAIVDALLGGEPGRLRVVAPRELAESEANYSSHGFGVAETVALADALGELPAHLLLVGIEVGNDLQRSPIGDALRGRLEPLLSEWFGSGD